jgi:uncharacterized membrane protein YidH (DUF202 family)
MNDNPRSDSAAPRLDTATTLAFERTRIAYERTMMAWIRTATSLITFGFAVYKFFQLELQTAPAIPNPRGPTSVMVAGALFISSSKNL